MIMKSHVQVWLLSVSVGRAAEINNCMDLFQGVQSRYFIFKSVILATYKIAFKLKETWK